MLDKNSLEDFKAALSAALRTINEADESLATRFVELRPGVVATLHAPVNHLVTGRRGVGKSTTLAVLQRQAEERRTGVIFVDIETHKSRSYPDVLIEIELDILDRLSPKWYSWRHRKLRRQIRRLQDVLRALRVTPHVITEETSDHKQYREDLLVELKGTLAARFLKLSASGGGSSSIARSSHRTSTQTRRKEEFLRDLAPALAEVLKAAAGMNGSGRLLLVLDDFYFIAKQIQPLVLDHLHGITKRSDVWLKIGSVHSRTQSFAEGDPPLGMQPPHDLQHLSLDVGLADFHTAKSFLERVADGVLKPAGFTVKDSLTDTARERAVLITGGAVSRDYFDLLISASDAAWEAAQRSDRADDSFHIDAEHVQAAAGRRLERKQTDLRNDAGRDAPALEARFSDLVNFCRDRNTYFFLVRRERLDSEWGRQVVELEDLRFVHRITTTRPNTGTMRGIDTTVFMVDIPALVQRRIQKAPVEFWKPGKSDELRKGSWVYTPEWEPSVKADTRKPPQNSRSVAKVSGSSERQGELDFG